MDASCVVTPDSGPSERRGSRSTTRFESTAPPPPAPTEIETYTWDMLPDDLKTGDIVEYVCREIEWVRDQLASSAGQLG